MKNVLFLNCLLYLFTGCNSNPIKNDLKASENLNTTNKNTNNDSSWSISEFKNDILSIDVTNHNMNNFSIHVKYQNEILDLDLNKLKIPFKTPELSWYNDQMVAITTWWSGPFSRMLFIPLKRPMKDLIYFDKDIQLADSATNFIVFIDTIYDQKTMILTAKNLINNKTTFIQYDIPPSSQYPYYDSIAIKNSNLYIWGKHKTIREKLIDNW